MRENKGFFFWNLIPLVIKGEESIIYFHDSSFFCLANYLNLSNVKKLVVYKRNMNYDLKGYTNPSQNWIIQ